MTLLKEQIKAANLESTEEEYLYKLALYCGDARMMTSCQNGGVAPADVVKRAQLEGLSRRYNSALLPLCDLNHSLCLLSQTPCQSPTCLMWSYSLCNSDPFDLVKFSFDTTPPTVLKNA